MSAGAAVPGTTPSVETHSDQGEGGLPYALLGEV